MGELEINSEDGTTLVLDFNSEPEIETEPDLVQWYTHRKTYFVVGSGADFEVTYIVPSQVNGNAV